MEFVRDHLVAIFIFAAIAISLMQILLRMKGNDPGKMQLLMGRQPIGDEEFHATYYPDVPQLMVTAARVLFANRARVPHKLLLPTDRLADFGIQDHADQVMAAIQRQPGYDADVTMPVTRVETLDDVIKLERWAIAQRTMRKAD
jgi:hypothetical protein